MPAWLEYVPAIALVALGYAALCAVSPVGTCRKCRGWGAAVSVSRFSGRLRRGRECRRCNGHGRTFRVGRRIYHRLARLHGDAHR